MTQKRLVRKDNSKFKMISFLHKKKCNRPRRYVSRTSNKLLKEGLKNLLVFLKIENNRGNLWCFALALSRWKECNLPWLKCKFSSLRRWKINNWSQFKNWIEVAYLYRGRFKKCEYHCRNSITSLKIKKIRTQLLKCS